MRWMSPWACAAVLCLGCSPSKPDQRPRPSRATSADATPDAGNDATATTSRAVFVDAEAGDVAALVASAVKAGHAENEAVLVYVGATWCEPCQLFHEAVTSGKLDRELQHVRFIEFDLDEDRGRLSDAGYTSRLIPLFAVPEADGRMSTRFTQGSSKGPGGVDSIMRRLTPLVDAARGGS